jgi:hypothetical protein
LFSIIVIAKFYPKTWTWRRILPFTNRYEITLKIADYNFFDPQKKLEFEELLRAKFKKAFFVS